MDLSLLFVRFVDILKENGEAGDIKECPLCQVLIMREAGCAQMMCGHCKHIFCWHCSKSLDVSVNLLDQNNNDDDDDDNVYFLIT